MRVWRHSWRVARRALRGADPRADVPAGSTEQVGLADALNELLTHHQTPDSVEVQPVAGSDDLITPVHNAGLGVAVVVVGAGPVDGEDGNIRSESHAMNQFGDFGQATVVVIGPARLQVGDDDGCTGVAGDGNHFENAPTVTFPPPVRGAAHGFDLAIGGVEGLAVISAELNDHEIGLVVARKALQPRRPVDIVGSTDASGGLRAVDERPAVRSGGGFERGAQSPGDGGRAGEEHRRR